MALRGVQDARAAKAADATACGGGASRGAATGKAGPRSSRARGSWSARPGFCSSSLTSSASRARLPTRPLAAAAGAAGAVTAAPVSVPRAAAAALTMAGATETADPRQKAASSGRSDAHLEAINAASPSNTSTMKRRAMARPRARSTRDHTSPLTPRAAASALGRSFETELGGTEDSGRGGRQCPPLAAKPPAAPPHRISSARTAAAARLRARLSWSVAAQPSSPSAWRGPVPALGSATGAARSNQATAAFVRADASAAASADASTGARRRVGSACGRGPSDEGSPTDARNRG